MFALLAVAAMSAALTTLPASADDKAPNPLAGTDPKARLEAAAALEKKDALALLRALEALGRSGAGAKPGDAARAAQIAADADFLVVYAVRETDRILRYTALRAAKTLDAKSALASLRKAADPKEKDATRLSLAAEALGLLGGKEDVPALLALLGHASENVAWNAANALGKVAAPGDADAILAAGLKHPEPAVSDHAAWAVQDLLKKPKVVVEKLDKIAKQKDNPLAIRADATAALILDNVAEPWKWGDSLAACAKLTEKIADKVPVEGADPASVKNVEATLEWMRENTPGAHLLVRAAVKKVMVPGPRSEDWIDLPSDAVCIPLSYAHMQPNKLAYNLHRLAVVVFEKRVGEPSLGPRAWYPALFDVYDICVAAKLYDAASGVSRDRLVHDLAAKTPWSGIQ